MKSVFIATLVLLIAGCSLGHIRGQNRERLLELSPGMTRHEVLSVMGTEKILTDDFDSITNPYRTELYRSGGNTFELLLYYTDKKRVDGAITDDELTPLVIMDGKLDGWGWSYWDSLLQKYEIRVR